MSPIGECGFAAEIPAFAGMEMLFLPKAKKSILTSALPPLPFRRKPESHSRDSENFPRSGTLQWSPVGECGFAAEIPAFAGMEVWENIFLPPAACGGGVKIRKANFWGVENLPPTPNKKNHPQARRAKNSASINTGLPVARFPGVHAVPAISKCAHAGQSEKCERNAAAVIAPPGRPPMLAKSA